MDIDYGDTLNYRAGRSEEDEKHICALQLPTIARATHLWTNEGDPVLTLFLGVGSEAYQAVKMKRKAVGIELKKSYFDEAVKNCIKAEQQGKQNSLFDNPNWLSQVGAL
jgi:DNA modification methylase